MTWYHWLLAYVTVGWYIARQDQVLPRLVNDGKHNPAIHTILNILLWPVLGLIKT